VHAQKEPGISKRWVRLKHPQDAKNEEGGIERIMSRKKVYGSFSDILGKDNVLKFD
jgi:hypothetical protein